MNSEALRTSANQTDPKITLDVGSRSESRPIVLACDQSYAMPLATTLRSIVDANRGAWPVEFHILSDGFVDAIKQRVVDSLPSGSASVGWYQVNFDSFQGVPIWAGVSKMIYARFHIPHILPETTSRVLFLDSDILVLDDLSPLWEMDLEGAALGAVLDDGVDLLIREGKIAERRIPRVEKYFNAGVLVIDLPRWREERISERAQEYVCQNPQTFFAEQDALNVTCEGRWKSLDRRWNFQRHLHEAIVETEQELRPAIVHFVTSEKPWDPASLSFNAAFYDSFRSRTNFARTLPQKVRDVFIAGWTKLKRLLEKRIVGPSRWSHLRAFARRVYKTAKC